MRDRILDALLRRLVVKGRLVVIYPDGTRRTYGSGPVAAPPPAGGPMARQPAIGEVVVRIHDAATVLKLLRNPDLGLAEGYMDERITIEDDDLAGLLDLALANRDAAGRIWHRWRFSGLRKALRRLTQRNPASRARANVAHHYDLTGELYELFLDQDRQYSCAYFQHAGMDLDAAQEAKKHHIARKLALQPGMHVLDIGCGWGGMAITLARDYGCRVTGITLSQEQLAWGQARIEREGLADRIELRLIDYRDLKGTFDRIVSVGMFEHVGLPHYPQFFAVVRDRLAENGVALLHTIGTTQQPGATSSFIDRYIFPGGALPALSEIAVPVQRSGLVMTDLEVLRFHYAHTLAAWYQRFTARAAEAEALFDARFVRMWRYYLLAAESSFRLGQLVVFQLQMARSPDALPITRNYLMDPPDG